MKAIRIAFCAATLLCMVSCGYSLVGRGAFLPAHIKDIEVPPFQDKTGWPKLSQIVTRTVTDKLTRQSGIQVVSNKEQVDAVLKGEILRFEQTPIAFTQGYATTYQVTITAGVKLRDVAERTDLYDNPSFIFRSEYDVPQDFDSFFDASEESIEEIALDFAEQLVTTILEGF